MAGLGGGSIASKTSQYTSVSPLGNMGAEAIPSQAEMGIVQSPESHAFRGHAGIRKEVVYVGAQEQAMGIDIW